MAFEWTDDPLTAGNIYFDKVHFTELHEALYSLFVEAGLVPEDYFHTFKDAWFPAFYTSEEAYWKPYIRNDWIYELRDTATYSELLISCGYTDIWNLKRDMLNDILGQEDWTDPVLVADETFIRNLLRDALNTKNQFVILDFNKLYAQIYKVEIEDENARGKKQLYAIILLRDVEYPLIPILHFKRIAMIFHKIDHEQILSDDKEAFQSFFKEINDVYMKKDEVLPLESINLQIRSGVNTIQGFCELLLEQKRKSGKVPEQELESYIEMMLDACKDIINTLDEPKASLS